MKVKNILKVVCIIAFLYISFFSIQNFWQGYHDVDTSFNFMRLGLIGDINTDGSFVMLDATYLRGVNRMNAAFIWLGLDCILGVFIGMLFKLGNGK